MVTHISALPAAPTRADPANFSDRADAFVTALSLFRSEANTLTDEVNAAAISAVNAPGTSATSTTSLAIGSGSKTLTIQTGKALVVGQWMIIASTASPANFMVGQVTAYNSGTGSLTVNAIYTGGSGTIAAWTVSLTLPLVAMPLTGGTFTGSVSFGAGASFPVGLSAGGTISAAAISASGAIAAGGLTVSGAGSFGGNITLTGGTPTLAFNSGGGAIWLPGSNQLAFGTAGTSAERMHIDSTGVVTVHGNRAAAGAAPGSGAFRVLANSAGGIAITTHDTQDYAAAQFVRDIGGTPTQIGSISVSDTTVVYGVGSDHRLKENIVALTGARDRLLQIPAKRFNFKANPSRTVDGFLAHEVAAVVPEAVSGAHDAMEAIGTAVSPSVLLHLGTATAPADLRQVGDATPPEGTDALPIVGVFAEAAPEGWTWAPTALVDLTPAPIADIVEADAPPGWTWAETSVVDQTPAPHEGIPERDCPAGWTWTPTGERPLYQQIDQAKLVPLLTAALQEAFDLIASLGGRVAALEAAL